MTEKMKLELVSQYDMPLMKSFQEIHDRVKDFCYLSLRYRLSLRNQSSKLIIVR